MQKVLFLCPHGAAKSVLARAYLQELIEANGSAIEITNAGTEPDLNVPAPIVKLLKKRGQDYASFKPREVTTEDIAAATVIVSIGCPIESMIEGKANVIYWNDAPLVSDGLVEASDFIEKRIGELFAQLTLPLIFELDIETVE